MAQLGAIQIWANAFKDPSAALEAYRSALKLFYSVPLPELYETAGAKFAFDEATIQAAVDLPKMCRKAPRFIYGDIRHGAICGCILLWQLSSKIRHASTFCDRIRIVVQK